MNIEPDYTRYTLEELVDAKAHIDENQYPTRAQQLDLLIKDRVRSKASGKIQRVSIADNDGNIAAVKTGRSVSFGRGLSSFAGALFIGLFWFNAPQKNDNVFEGFSLLMLFSVVSALVSGCYYFYNAFATNRFTEQDFVAPDKEPDPFSEALGLGKSTSHTSCASRQFKGDYCPYCSVRVQDDFDFCPGCGKDI